MFFLFFYFFLFHVVSEIDKAQDNGNHWINVTCLKLNSNHNSILDITSVASQEVLPAALAEVD